MHAGRQPAPGSPACLIRPEVRDGPGHRGPSGPGLSSNEPRAPMPSPRSAANMTSHPSLPREQLPWIAAPCRQPARHWPVPGELPSRQRPRRADEHRAPRRAARPLGWPRPRPGGQALVHHWPGPPDRHLLPLSRPLSPAWRVAGAGLPAERRAAAGTGFARTGQTWPAGGYAGHAQHAGSAGLAHVPGVTRVVILEAADLPARRRHRVLVVNARTLLLGRARAG